METARCKAFLSAAQCGSLTAAADELGYTPSGVSQLVTALEDDLGFKLLDRTKKGVSLTREGERILPEIRRFVADETAIYEKASDINGMTVGSVTISSYPSVATYWLPSVIRKFREDYPGIEINLMEGIQQEMMEWINEGTADIGFLTYTEAMNCEWIPLAEDRMVAVLANDHPLADCDAYPLDHCEQEDFIMPALGHDVDVEELLTKHHIKPDIKFSTMENPVMMGMIRAGLGMSIMNELCTTLWKDQLTIIPLDPPAYVTFGIAYARNRHQSPAAEKFMEYAVRMLTRESAIGRE